MPTNVFFQPTAGEIQAACVVMRRKARVEHAKRNSKLLKWHPASEERMPCCDTIREPSRRFPFSLQDHCRTAAHVAELLGEDEAKVRATIRFFTKRGLEPKQGESLAEMVDRATSLTPAGAARVLIRDRARLARAGEGVQQEMRHEGA